MYNCKKIFFILNVVLSVYMSHTMNRDIEISGHAKTQMRKRGIKPRDVRNVVIAGNISADPKYKCSTTYLGKYSQKSGQLAVVTEPNSEGHGILVKTVFYEKNEVPKNKNIRAEAIEASGNSREIKVLASKNMTDSEFKKAIVQKERRKKERSKFDLESNENL